MVHPLNTSTAKQYLLSLFARVLPLEEQKVVLGDLEEAGDGLLTSTGAIAGYAVRRELTAWASLDSWLILLLVVMPCALMLGSVSQSTADRNARCRESSAPVWLWFPGPGVAVC